MGMRLAMAAYLPDGVGGGWGQPGSSCQGQRMRCGGSPVDVAASWQEIQELASAVHFIQLASAVPSCKPSQ